MGLPPTIETFLNSCKLRLQKDARTIYPCSNCQHIQGSECNKLGIAIAHPPSSTCPAFESAGKDKALLLCEQLVSVMPEEEKTKFEQLLAKIRDETPTGIKMLARAIELWSGKELYGGLGDK